MAKSQAIILLAVALCLFSLAGVSNADTDQFSVEGMVYCDTCRLQFMTRVSSFMEGATVRLQCRNITTGIENYNAEAVTDKSGHYTFQVSGDYEDDICQITLVKSSNDDCSEIATEAIGQQGAQISLTSNNGEATPVRNANPLGFMKKEPLSECDAVIKELEMDFDEEAEDEGHDTSASEIGSEQGSGSGVEQLGSGWEKVPVSGSEGESGSGSN